MKHTSSATPQERLGDLGTQIYFMGFACVGCTRYVHIHVHVHIHCNIHVHLSIGRKVTTHRKLHMQCILSVQHQGVGAECKTEDYHELIKMSKAHNLDGVFLYNS